MARFYGDTRDPRDDEDRAARQLARELTREQCRYCRAAQKRKGDSAAECKKHRDAARLAYLTSTSSETYWAS